jgi:hypothetical protein
MNPRYPAVARRAGHRCEYCRAPEVIFNFAFEVEHIVASTRGGLDDESNLALACRACNLYKSDRLAWVDADTGQEVHLFNPRCEIWETHFRVDAETGAVVGLTPNGRATVACLRMNQPEQVAARRRWALLGLFP